MTNVYLPDLVQIRPTYKSPDGNTHFNVLWFSNANAPGGFSVAELTAWQTAFDGAWSSQWAGTANNNWHYTGSIITDFQSNTGNQVGNTAYTPVAGGQSGGEPGQQVALLCSLKDPKRYRGGHGRIYLCGQDITYLSQGKTWGSGVNTGWSTFLNNNIGGTSGIHYTYSGTTVYPSLGILHKKLKGTSPYLQEPIAVVVQTTAATQRRRIRKAPHH